MFLNIFSNQILRDLHDDLTASLRGTPRFLINGKLVVGAQPFSFFQQATEAALNEIDQE